MADVKLLWDDNKQQFYITKFATKGGSAREYFKESDIPTEYLNKAKGVQSGDTFIYKSVTIPQSEFNRIKPVSSKLTEMTKEEYSKKLSEGLAGSKTSPLPKQTFSFAVSRKDVIDENNIFINTEGVPVYIDPETKEANAAGQVIIIKPGAEGGIYAKSDKFVVTAAEKEIQDILSNANKTKDGIKQLKEKLYYGGYYHYSNIDGQLIARSLANENSQDLELQTALTTALLGQSVQNWNNIKAGKKAFNLDGWLDFSKDTFASSQEKKQVNLPSELNVAKVANNAYLKFAGRRATPNEIMALQAAAFDMARANPDITSTDLRLGVNTSVSQPGFGPDELSNFAEEYVKAQSAGQEWGNGQGGMDTFTGAINILLRDIQSSRSARMMPGEK